MKVIRKNRALKETVGNLLAEAKSLEAEGNLKEAADVYEKIIKKSPTKDYAYDRLMIIYRKKGEYKKEKAVIDAGIKTFEQFYKSASRLPAKKSIATLSQALLKATGLADKKGKPLFEREPLGRWKKRLITVQKKLK